MCSITGQRQKLLKVFGQIGLHQLGTFSAKSLVSLNACVRVIYFPPTAKVIRRRSQFIVPSERLDYKSSSLTTRPRRLLWFSISCSQVSSSGSLSLLFSFPMRKMAHRRRKRGGGGLPPPPPPPPIILEGGQHSLCPPPPLLLNNPPTIPPPPPSPQ